MEPFGQRPWAPYILRPLSLRLLRVTAIVPGLEKDCTIPLLVPMSRVELYVYGAFWATAMGSIYIASSRLLLLRITAIVAGLTFDCTTIKILVPMSVVEPYVYGAFWATAMGSIYIASSRRLLLLLLRSLPVTLIVTGLEKDCTTITIRVQSRCYPFKGMIGRLGCITGFVWCVRGY